ncbi:hypothetical protein OSTOST_22650 [Ostertagia ostertagi]
MLLQAFKKNNFTLTMKLDWEKTGQHGDLYSWNRCTLPRVISRDQTAITLEQLLQIPGRLEEITEEVSSVAIYVLSNLGAGVLLQMALKSIEKGLYATNSSQDDTLEANNLVPWHKVKTKHRTNPYNPTTANTMDTVSHTGYMSKEPARSKYQAAKGKSKEYKYDPSAHSKSIGVTSNTQGGPKRRYKKAQVCTHQS